MSHHSTELGEKKLESDQKQKMDWTADYTRGWSRGIIRRWSRLFCWFRRTICSIRRIRYVGCIWFIGVDGRFICFRFIRGDIGLNWLFWRRRIWNQRRCLSFNKSLRRSGLNYLSRQTILGLSQKLVLFRRFNKFYSTNNTVLYCRSTRLTY